VFLAVEDYSRDLRELEARFSTEARCGETKSWPKGDGLVRCAGCNYQISVIAGTVLGQPLEVAPQKTRPAHGNENRCGRNDGSRASVVFSQALGMVTWVVCNRIGAERLGECGPILF
jgi:hypothetical protein